MLFGRLRCSKVAPTAVIYYWGMKCSGQGKAGFPDPRVAHWKLWRGRERRMGVTGHCPRRADILSALDAAQPLSGSYEHRTSKADRMSARRSFGRDGGGSARLRLMHITSS